jgi:hypothetical protein
LLNSLEQQTVAVELLLSNALERIFIKERHMSGTYKRGRDAKTGKFLPVEVAERRKSTAIVETVKKKK